MTWLIIHTEQYWDLVEFITDWLQANAPDYWGSARITIRPQSFRYTFVEEP